jgi:hypothetical protein
VLELKIHFARIQEIKKPSRTFFPNYATLYATSENKARIKTRNADDASHLWVRIFKAVCIVIIQCNSISSTENVTFFSILQIVDRLACFLVLSKCTIRHQISGADEREAFVRSL